MCSILSSFCTICVTDTFALSYQYGKVMTETYNKKKEKQLDVSAKTFVGFVSS